jgi:DNA-binding NarL/FixJ family response regulator
MTRAGMEAVLRNATGISVVTSSDEADVILTDVDPNDSETPYELPAVLLSADPQLGAITEALRWGAKAVISQDSTQEQVAAAIHGTAAGLVVIEPQAIEQLRTGSRPAEASEPLTARESEVLNMMAEGLANKVIAYRLGISEHTVKFHVNSVMSKLNASSRTEAVMLGLRQGLIML